VQVFPGGDGIYILEAGIDSLKIEGRAKGVNYVAGAVRAYRLALDSYLEDPDGYRFRNEWLDELKKLSHREYDTGFYLGSEVLVAGNASYVRKYDFVGVVREAIDDGFVVEARNKTLQGDRLEVMGRGRDIIYLSVDSMSSMEGEDIPHAQPGQLFVLKSGAPLEPLDILRREKS